MSLGYVAAGLAGVAVAGLLSGDDAGDASREGAQLSADATVAGAQIQAKSQREALEYLKEREKLPRQISEKALSGLAGIYSRGEGQQDLINRAISSPLYQAMLGGKQAGEESILRNASVTGGLRSGNVQQNLYDYNTQLSNQALLQSYNDQIQGLTGLAGLPSYARDIAGMQAGIGQTLGAGQAQAGNIMAQGSVAGAQADQAARQQNINNLLGIGSLALMYSDRRLKKNVRKVGTVNGWNWYRWDWNIVAQKMGLKGSCQGVMADEVFKEKPDAVIMHNLFMMVDYSKLEEY